jgi:2-polyprenyl-3-methyl-5-hydroxy-6-metoxy-1,4-benzoquinol methylase
MIPSPPEWEVVFVGGSSGADHKLHDPELTDGGGSPGSHRFDPAEDVGARHRPAPGVSGSGDDYSVTGEQMTTAEHYDASAATYHLQYEREGLRDLSRAYPANYFRLQMLLNSFVENDVRRVVEVGVGEGTPLATLARAGMEVSGFDISQAMVERSKERMTEIGQSPDRIIWGDIEDPTTYADLLRAGQFDGLMAMGVMPHIRNDVQVLRNMEMLVRPGGLMFVEFRNKLFSLFTFNRYTYEFVMDDLLAGVSDTVRSHVGTFLRERLVMDMPPRRETHYDDEEKVGYDAILSRFHNPFEVTELFDRLGLEDIELLWYHYHPAMPLLAEKDPAAFREEAIRLEHEPSGWRGLFLCSAFVVQARKPLP